MAGGSAIRGSRVGAGPLGESERGQSVAKVRVNYHCASGHAFTIPFAFDVEEGLIPEIWDCPTCGLPAGQDQAKPPQAPKNEPYKTHLAYVMERRGEEELDETLHRALDSLQSEFEI